MLYYYVTANIYLSNTNRCMQKNEYAKKYKGVKKLEKTKLQY